MLTHPLFEQLRQLRCQGMIEALKEQMNTPDIESMSFDERFALLIERESIMRENRRLKTRLTKAKLKAQACIADIDHQQPRGLAKPVMTQLAQCTWVVRKENIILTGPTGTGKTYIACALAHQACLQGYTAQYMRLPRLLQALDIARGDGSYAKFMMSIAKLDLLILDDWGITPMSDNCRRDLLEIVDDRHNQSATIITSQLPIKLWHEYIGDPTLADAILDRMIHNAHKISLEGDSMRKKSAEQLSTKDENN